MMAKQRISLFTPEEVVRESVFSLQPTGRYINVRKIHRGL